LELASLGAEMRWEVDVPFAGPTDRAETRALERFLFEIERRAYRIARIAVQNDDDALDIVQDSMLQLARRYGQHPSDQWRPLFFRVLQNRIRDCLRRRKVRARLLGWLPVSRDEENAPDPLEQVADDRPQPLQHAVTDKAMQVLELALAALPARQQEAFMLRNFEGLDVAQTARAMGCSEGSAKTHYSRAVHSLRDRLGDVW
jgi:RNA polymerase sigma-70 factor, ECF subfamily